MSFLRKILLSATCLLPVVMALPQTKPPLSSLRSTPSTIHDTPVFNRLYQRQEPSILNVTCEWTEEARTSDFANAVEAIAQYLEGVSNAGSRCAIDSGKPYQNLVATSDGFEANLFFSGLEPTITHTEYECNDLADQLRAALVKCNDSRETQVVLMDIQLANCLSINTQFSTQPALPYIEGNTLLEFRDQAFASPGHSN